MEEYVTFFSIFRVSAPAVVLNVAPPLTLAIQTACLGKSSGASIAQAAFAAVVTPASALSFLFNFLTDGVSAKVGQKIGEGDMAAAAVQARLAVFCSLGAGLLASASLALLKWPTLHLMQLEPSVEAAAGTFAGAYWDVRIILMPLLLLNMSFCGILQGFNRVSWNATINTGQSILESLGSYIVLLTWPPANSATLLVRMGCVTIACTLISVSVGGLCLLFIAPPSKDGGGAGSANARLEQEEQLLPPAEEALVVSEAMADAQQQHAAAPSTLSHLADFLQDGLNMFLRSTVLQATFFLAVTVASRLGTKSLAAYEISTQLWVVASYVVDGLAVAATVLGSRLASRGPEGARLLQKLTLRLLWLGVLTGLAAGIVFFTLQDRLIGLFTHDADTIAVLKDGLWLVLSVVQPINSVGFVGDGLMLATNSFVGIRNIMASAFAVVYLPLLALSYYKLHTVCSIWVAKSAMNVWRLGGTMLWTFWWLRQHQQPQMDEGSGP